MSSRFAKLYSVDFDTDDFAHLVDTFVQQQFSLINPYTGQMETLNDEGDLRVTTFDQMRAKVKAKKSFHCVFWTGERDDLIVRIRFDDRGFTAEDYYFNAFQIGAGLEPIINLLVSRFKDRLASKKSFGLVVDAYGATDGFDWDVFFTKSEILEEGDKRLWGTLPTVIGIQELKLRQIKADLSNFRKDVADGFIILSKM